MLTQARMGLVAAVVAGAAGAGLLASLPAVHTAAANRERGDEPVLSGGPAERIRYGRDIRPILSDRCFACHGADPATRAADLRLDLAESATADRKGVRAIVPGDPERSELWRRIHHADPDQTMPPPDAGKRSLSAGERELIERWIREGGEYEPHWAFVPPVRPALPEVRDTTWPRSPVDRFVLATLEAVGLPPNPEADRATLLRRVFLDLTGLPPTLEELDAFLADPRPDAYERWVDRLLEEEPYRSRHAERMTSPWLDQARYGDTHGIHHDQSRSMWPWRDWVLAAYRDNMPFDQFVTEQIAGDLVAAAEPKRGLGPLVATGFLRNNVASDEGGAIDEEYRFEYAVDRVSTVGSVFLGLTVGCARCHDHKYDPLAMEEFYGLLAYFNSVDEPGLYPFQQQPDLAQPPAITLPSPEAEAKLVALRAERASLQAERDRLGDTPEEQAAFGRFLAALRGAEGFDWKASPTIAATSAGGATLTVEPDGSTLSSGTNPGADDQTFVLRTDATQLRAIRLDALTDPSVGGRVGRSDNGNVVLTAFEAEAVSVADPSRREPIAFRWAWADDEQDNGDFRALAAISDDPPRGERGWAVGGHLRPGGRSAIFLADRPFGFEGGTELRVTLRHHAIWAAHTFVRVRFAVATVAESALAALPPAFGPWYRAGPFPTQDRSKAYDEPLEPQEALRIDTAKEFAFANRWTLDQTLLQEATVAGLGETIGNVFLARSVHVPTARRIELALGSDDGLRVFLNGSEAFANKVDRGITADADRVFLDLPAGRSTVVVRVTNTGGPSAFVARSVPAVGEFQRALVAAALPADEGRDAALLPAYLASSSPAYRDRTERIVSAEKAIAAVEAALPRTMVWKDLPSPRETFVMLRGQYDHPDRSRPVRPGVPAFLRGSGASSADSPPDRLALARWMTSPEHPLLARVAANRLWEMLFGLGLVATGEDFGFQGEWPSHPELLDWLAVEFRESGWDQRHLLRTIVTSATYRQSSQLRPDIAAIDPERRLLAAFPRQRLTAEAIRDQALAVGGLLHEQLGGAGVRPYQPAGLWEEISMLDSNTRTYVPSDGPDRWRRSVYTYWKRAAPPPAMLTFDAPTREFCAVRRIVTNTPLQALVLWNDEQFVEAARGLAARTLLVPGDDVGRIAFLLRTATGSQPSGAQTEAFLAALATFRSRYATDPDDAAKLLTVGPAPLPAEAKAIAPAELAAWTLLANAVLSSEPALVKD